MKKLLSILTAIALCAFVAGCATPVQRLVYDKPLQENQTATLIIHRGFTVTSFNGEPVQWSYSGDVKRHLFQEGGEPAVAIKVPAGNNSIAFSFQGIVPKGTTVTTEGTLTHIRSYTSSVAFDGHTTFQMIPSQIYILELNKDYTNGIIERYIGGYKNLP